VGVKTLVKIGLALSCYPETDSTWSYVPPLGLGYLASYTRKYVEGVEFVVERRAEELISHQPDFVGLTFVTFNYSYAAREARKIKDALGCPVICGGPHVSTLPTVLDPVFDLAVLGEGEETFADLVRLFKEKKRFPPEDLRNIPGLLFRDEDGQLIRNPARAAIKDLDTIPFPDRDLIHNKWSCHGGMVNIMTSRGCPYDCSFCSTIHHWGRGFRYPSNEYVVREIEEIREKFDPSEILIFDDLFVVNRSRVIELNNLIRQRGLHEGLEFRCFVRANLLNDELMESLAQTNHKVLNIGFESGSEDMLFKLKKTGCSVEENEHALYLGRKYGVTFSSCFIMGTPGETREDILANFDFVLSNTDVFDNVSFAPLQILPMTQVWEWAREVGVSDTNLSGIVLEQEDFEDEKEFFMNKWHYLNQHNIPREEFYTYYMIGKKVEKTVDELAKLRKKLVRVDQDVNLQYAASNIPLVPLMKEKARRRLRMLMPTEPSLLRE
jgi:anaerobic magnesium-protoporphyrin IX monomethyl ester cyclase